MHLAVHVTLKVIDDFMLVLISKVLVVVELIRMQGGAFFRILAHKALHILQSPICYNLCSRVSTALNHAKHNSLTVIARRLSGIDIACVIALLLQAKFAALMHIPRFATNESFVNFNRSSISSD